MEKTNNFRNNNDGRLAGGLILVAVGAVLLLRNTGFDLPRWLFSWPMILILVGIYTGFKHNFRNNSWLIIFGIGLFFLVSKFIPSLSLEPLFWPIIIIGAGIVFMLRPGNSRWNTGKNNPGVSPDLHHGATSQYSGPDYLPGTVDTNDYLIVKSVFSGVNKNIVSKNFRGGTVASVFGGSQIDLRQADITGPVVIKLEIVFGGTKLIVPPHWTVQNEIDGIFHGVDDKRNFNPAAGINPEKVLILKGSAVFGGVEIRSY